MKAVFVDQGSPPSFGDFRDPEPTPDQALVTIRAAALTNLDVIVAEGRHYFSPKAWPVVVGREAVALADGRRVYLNVNAMTAPSGSMAERAAADLRFALPVPDDVSDAIAAAIGNAGLAGWLPLSWRAKLRPGESVLILGATGTTGKIAVAAAALLGAGRVVAVGRDRQTLQALKAAGADAVVELGDGLDLAQAYGEALGGRADIVLDYLNGPPAEAALQVMATGGRMVQIGSMLAPGIQLPAQVARRYSLDVLGFAYYHAPIAEQISAYAKLCAAAVAGHVAIDCTSLPLDRFREAWAQQKAGSRTRFVLHP